MFSYELHIVQSGQSMPTIPMSLELEHPTTQQAADYIRKHPGAKGIAIDDHIGTAHGHFRNHIFPKLKHYGFTSSRRTGYRFPK
jgi:hypothetical protein